MGLQGSRVSALVAPCHNHVGAARYHQHHVAAAFRDYDLFAFILNSPCSVFLRSYLALSQITINQNSQFSPFSPFRDPALRGMPVRAGWLH